MTETQLTPHGAVARLANVAEGLAERNDLPVSVRQALAAAAAPVAQVCEASRDMFWLADCLNTTLRNDDPAAVAAGVRSLVATVRFGPGAPPTTGAVDVVCNWRDRAIANALDTALRNMEPREKRLERLRSSFEHIDETAALAICRILTPERTPGCDDKR